MVSITRHSLSDPDCVIPLDHFIGDLDQCPLTEESLLFVGLSNIVFTSLKGVTVIVFVNQMLLMLAGDVERNPGPGKNELKKDLL